MTFKNEHISKRLQSRNKSIEQEIHFIINYINFILHFKYVYYYNIYLFLLFS